MSDRRIHTGSTIDSELYRKLKIRAVTDNISIGKALDEAIEFYLQNKRRWPDDDNEERE
jgi:hypothetical protein